MIPLILKLRIKDKNHKRFGIWLPLFLIWLIILPILAIPAPLIFLVALILWPSSYGRLVLYSYFAIFSIIWNLSGVNLDIQSKGSIVYLDLR